MRTASKLASPGVVGRDRGFGGLFVCSVHKADKKKNYFVEWPEANDGAKNGRTELGKAEGSVRGIFTSFADELLRALLAPINRALVSLCCRRRVVRGF
jgi:hypothetical protein